MASRRSPATLESSSTADLSRSGLWWLRRVGAVVSGWRAAAMQRSDKEQRRRRRRVEAERQRATATTCNGDGGGTEVWLENCEGHNHWVPRSCIWKCRRCWWGWHFCANANSNFRVRHEILSSCIQIYCESVIRMEYENRYLQAQRQKYDCLLFDLDDTLYPLSSGLSTACLQNIKEYMVEKLGIEKSKISDYCNLLYKHYGTTMAGLRAIGYDFDYDEYHM